MNDSKSTIIPIYPSIYPTTHAIYQITASGPSIMTGYRNNPAANEEVFYQHEGTRYFRTGDVGKMVEGKFLKITGRVVVYMIYMLISSFCMRWTNCYGYANFIGF